MLSEFRYIYCKIPVPHASLRPGFNKLCVLTLASMNTGRFATGKVSHRKVRHKIGKFATALEGSHKCH